MSSPQPNSLEYPVAEFIRSRACPACYVCGCHGEPLYENLQDRLFGAAGLWNLKSCSNPRCGLVWLDPMPREEDIGKAYEGYVTHSDPVGALIRPTLPRRLIRAVKKRYLSFAYGYTNGGTGFYHKVPGLFAYLAPFRRAGLNFTVMYLPALPGGRLLDVGCGSGTMLKSMGELGWQVEGVDFDPGAVENCKSKGLKVNLGKLEDVHYAENTFDAIMMSHMIEHVHSPLGLLAECRRILKPGGRLSIATPNINSLGRRMFRSSWFPLDPPRHLHLFTVEALKTLLRKAGFRRMKVFTSIHGANMMFVANRSIKLTGRYRMGAPHSRVVGAWAKMMQTIEWTLLNIGFEVGEELTVLAEK
jgi:2-polyprenyl-3-methyl-5-hydroxy-6-metoxy-1,4-benzoquinol methylase